MNKKGILAEWEKRLCNGKFKHLIGRLAQDDCRCALGILCDIAEENGVVERSIICKEGHDVVLYGSCEYTVPYEVIKWSGLSLSIANQTASSNDNPKCKNLKSLSGLVSNLRQSM